MESITPLGGGRVRTVMTIAGSDSSGGAGIEADIKTITAHRCYALTDIVTLTAQNTTGVADVVKISEKLISSILKENFSDIPIDSIKTGILTEESIPVIKNALDEYNFHGYLVLDPVMVSTSGCDFVSSKTLKVVADYLVPYITLITPNLIEAKALINTLSGELQYNDSCLETLEDIFLICCKIHQLTGIKNVLVKGGHQKWKDDARLLTDVLYFSESETYYVFYSEMIDSLNTHGTGCTLSSAIASNLASGLSLVNSVANGITYVQNGIKTAPNLGSGHGPLNHLQDVSLFNYESLVNDAFALPFEKGKAIDFLCNHPHIKKFWSEYTNHAFMKKIGDLSLPLTKFIDFVEQNVIYLVNYSHVLMFMATKRKSAAEIQQAADELKTVAEEISKYKSILKELGYKDDEIDNIKANKACQVYIDCLLDVAKHAGDALDIAVSLIPCFYGYFIACSNISTELFENKDHSIKDEVKHRLYGRWITQNKSKWYSNACLMKESELNFMFETSCSSQIKLARVIQIFEKFTVLEIEFLSSFI